MMRNLTAAVLALLALVVLGGAVLAQGTDIAAVASAFNAAATNPDAGVALAADNIRIQVVPPPPGTNGIWTGKDGARAFLQFTTGQNVKRTLVDNWKLEGDKVSGVLNVSTNDFNNLKLGTVQHAIEMTIADGKVKTFTSTMLPAEQQRVGAARAAAAGQQPQALPTTGGAAMLPALAVLLLGIGVITVGLAAMRRRATA